MFIYQTLEIVKDVDNPAGEKALINYTPSNGQEPIWKCLAGGKLRSYLDIRDGKDSRDNIGHTLLHRTAQLIG